MSESIVKRFRVVVIDDEGPAGLSTGWPRFLRLMQDAGYLDSGDLYHFDENSQKGEGPAEQSMSLRIFSSHVGTAPGRELVSFYFSEALDIFDQDEVVKGDIFVFDLQLNSGPMNPSLNGNRCDRAKLHQGSDAIDTAYAGLHFVGNPQLQYPDPRPKIIYSAAAQTATLRKVLPLLRLPHIHIVEVTGEQSIARTKKILDPYLHLKQTDVLRRAGRDVRATLARMIDTPEVWRKPIVPDPYSREFWSFRTLFPRQTNEMANPNHFSTTSEDVKRELRDILSSQAVLSWAELMAGTTRGEIQSVDEGDRSIRGLMKHPNAESERVFLPLAKKQDFTVSGAAAKIYCTFTSTVARLTEPLDELRDSILSKCECTKTELLVKCCSDAEFRRIATPTVVLTVGLFPPDLVYVWHIAVQNFQRHQGRLPNIQSAWISMGQSDAVLNGRPLPTGVTSVAADCWAVRWDIESAKPVNFTNLKEKLHGWRPTRDVLENEGMQDLAKIVVGRYSGQFSLVSAEGKWIERESGGELCSGPVDTSLVALTCIFPVVVRKLPH
jgi:hypothetical protein